MYICFSDLFSNYVYDSIVNDIIEISDKMYKVLTEGLLVHKSLDKEYSKLINKGFLSKSHHKISYPLFNFEKSLFTRSLSNAVIQVTQDCNFRCNYCVFTSNDGSNRLHKSNSIDWYTMKDSIDFIHKSSIDSDKITISFYGGEPFLETDLIKKSIEYANYIFKGKPLLYSITTNASMLTDELLKFLNENNVSLTISLDGPKHINDKYRHVSKKGESSYEYAKTAIDNIYYNYNNLAKLLNVNMVLVPTNSFKEYLSILKDIPHLKNIQIIASLVSEEGLSSNYPIKEDFISGIEYSLFLNRLIEYDFEQIDDILDKSKLTENYFKQKKGQIKAMIATGKQNLSPSGPCIPIHHKIFIDIYGNLLPCEKISEKIDDIKVGDIFNGINFEKVNKAVKLANYTKAECENCWAFNLCSSCIKYCVDDKRISREARLSFCNQVKDGAKSMLYEYASLKRENVIRHKKMKWEG